MGFETQIILHVHLSIFISSIHNIKFRKEYENYAK